jgi:O-antigen ligase
MPFYYLTLLLIPFATHPLLGYNFHGFTPVKVAGGLALVFALLPLNDSPTQLQFSSRSRLYFGLLIAFLLFSMAANGLNIGDDRIFWFVSILMFYVTTLRLVTTKERLLASCVALLIAMDIASAYMLRQYIQGASLYKNFRPGGTFGDANYYAASALGVLPIAYFLGKRSGGKMLSRFGLGSVCAILVGLVISQSRGGMIGLGAIVLAFIYESKARMRAATFLCVAAILFLMFSPINPIQRFFEPGTGDKGSTNAHIKLFYAGLRMIHDYPVFGVGMGQFRAQSMAYAEGLSRPYMAHNSFLELAADNGIPALILYLLMCLAVMKDLTNARYLHSQDSLTGAVLIGMRLGFIGFLAAATFISAEYEKVPWIICFFAMAMARVEPETEHLKEFEDPNATPGHVRIEPQRQAEPIHFPDQ